MIFISAGNNELSFIRLFKSFENIFCKLKKKKLKVICQVGYTDYTNENFHIVKFLEKKNFNELVKKSSLFISHAGAGSVIDSIINKKIPILLPREKKFNEHIDNHQIELYHKLTKINLASPLNQIYSMSNKKFKRINSKKKIIF